MIHVLKITETMWKHIEAGRKVVEVRKLNKDYIKVGDTILYVNLRCDTIYGKRLVTDRIKATREQILFTKSETMDIYTKLFVKENYKRVQEFIVFNIKGVDTWLDFPIS